MSKQCLIYDPSENVLIPLIEDMIKTGHDRIVIYTFGDVLVGFKETELCGLPVHDPAYSGLPDDKMTSGIYLVCSSTNLAKHNKEVDIDMDYFLPFEFDTIVFCFGWVNEVDGNFEYAKKLIKVGDDIGEYLARCVRIPIEILELQQNPADVIVYENDDNVGKWSSGQFGFKFVDMNWYWYCQANNHNFDDLSVHFYVREGCDNVK